MECRGAGATGVESVDFRAERGPWKSENRALRGNKMWSGTGSGNMAVLSLTTTDSQTIPLSLLLSESWIPGEDPGKCEGLVTKHFTPCPHPVR